MDNASSSYKLPRKYDVLINFNGEDIHRKFVSHLNYALSTVGLTTFLHYHNAVKSTHIQEPILSRCRVAIVVFTQTYSQSAWCLDQLQQIIKWHETYCRHVLPVYYEIQPSDVRLQKGDFGKALKETAQQTFSGQELEHGMSRWSHALTKAANFFGWDESNHRSDAELVEKIVKSVVNLPVLSATKFPVGLQSHVEDLIRTIKNKSTEVCMIEIHGPEGSGKSTLAKAIYNQIHWTFKHKSFIENISQVSGIRGQLRLQEQLLLDVLKQKMEIPSVDVGRTMIRERLLGKKVLIVLDDVNYFNNLFDLWDCLKLLVEGTVIIVTSIYRIGRDQVHSDFRVEPMNEEESLELFSWHAFREAKPKEEYEDLARKVVSYCKGLPLVLEVVGSSLFKRTKEEWNSVLFKFEKVDMQMVNKRIFREIIKVSIEGSLNEMEKDIFLDICCFFIGKSRAYVRKILNGCGVDADIAIRVLIERNLVKTNKNNKLGMHPSLQQIGIQIIHENSGKDFGKNRRLWFYKDTKYGTEAMQWLPFNAFETLQPTVNSKYLLKKLRWISWHGLSSEGLPNNLYEHDAIAIDLKRSLLRFLWKTPQVLRSLKVLNLSHSKHLTTTPDFTGLPSLEHLIFKYCSRLSKLHQSIGSLNSLILLNLKYCTSLYNLPTEIYDLKSLRTFILSGCSKIDIMDKDIAKLESLITLIAENTTVKEVPFSIVSSKSIGYISLRRFEGLSHNLFPSIIRSWMSPIMNPISYIHSFCMDTEDNTIDIAPLLSTLANIRSFLVACDTEFELSKQLKNILVEYFANITESGISKQHFRCSLIGVGAYHQFFNAVSDNISQVLSSSECGDVCLPAVNDPYCLAHMGEGHSVSFVVPEDGDMKGIILCVVYLSTPKIIEPEFTTVVIVNYTKCTFHIHNHGTVISFKDEDWHDIMSNLEYGDNVEIFVNFGNGLVVKNTIVYLICGESKNMKKVSEPKKHSLIRFIKKVVM
ncbi:disease resistance protein RPV1-like [Vigna angularis]|uniref:disease resistance protein RPV1-like n=1 Tax=Phaseolus angularis TaxID=3914 RepID=UPI0022B33B53|nr:disease resistance protein RPV1-like [Vigna angularis]